MHRDDRTVGILLAVACMLLGAGLAWASFLGTASASYSAARNEPLIKDRLHHLSGVVAVPPERVLRGAARNATSGLERLLTPPTFGPNVDASLNNSAAQNETTIAINPEDNTRLIASGNDYRAGLQPWVYLSTDGGANWTNYQVPGTTSLFYGDPAMAFGRNNSAYFTYLGYQSLCANTGGMYASRSTDAGSTFDPPVQLAPNTNNGQVALFQDKEYVAVDNMPGSPHQGNVYAAWTQFAFRAGASCGDPSTQIEAPSILTRSTDEGLTWSAPITVSPPISNNTQGNVPAVGRHGEVYVYYLGAQTQTQLNYDTVLFSRSTDGGQTFPFFTHIAGIVDIPSPLPNTAFRTNPFGAPAVDQQLDGYLYAVWSDYRTGDADILMSRSTDNGNTWGPPQRVNDDPSGNGKDQFFPWITTSPDGILHATWFDRREDPGNANYKAYYTYSTDHGATFAPNVAVSTEPSVPGNNPFIGDYSGIAASTGVVMPIWTDIRTGGNQNAYTSRGVYAPKATATSTVTATPSATVTSTATRTPCVMGFTDVQLSDYFYEAVRYLYCVGAISGYEDGTFRPFNNITRAQLSKVVVLAEGWTLPIFCTEQAFVDVPPSHPFYLYVQTAYCQGVISGYTCGPNCLEFRPYNDVTRAQLCKIIVLAEEWLINTKGGPHFTDVPETNLFYDFIETAYNREIISGYKDGTFRWGNSATRGQISKIIHRAVTAP